MDKEGKTQSVIFRLSPSTRAWLDVLVKDSPAQTISGYLKTHIFQDMRKYMFEKAIVLGMHKVAEEFNIPKILYEDFESSADEDIFLAILQIFDKETAKKILLSWLENAGLEFIDLQNHYECFNGDPDEPRSIHDLFLRMNFLLNKEE